MVKEFYANAWELDKEKRKPYTYTTMVRGKDISFAPSNIKRVLKLRKDPLPNAASYHERKANKHYRLEHVLEDLCIEGADWVRHKDGRPHYLRRADLEPMTKGWYEFVCRSILPTTNCSELTVERAQRQEQEKQEQETQGKQDKKPLLNNNHLKSNHNPKSTINKISLQTSTLTLMPPCHKSIGGSTNNKRRVGRAFEAINTRMDRMDDQISFLCYSNQMANEQMLFPYQNTSRQFKEMEMQGIPVTMANLVIHRQMEEEMNQERMRYDQILQEAAAQQAKKANKGKAREVVPDSEEELASSASEEW
ncbi:hypothetical protein PIB30_058692 [Stylosanthes scabra]|uniref:Putative plant transposon protein domain-containing protein n=1 Tax=Stylosanthes scabra TaxID=79078 RepID=A0ABU6WIB3_9FABA|nr:hypothetical protein [Stylosanthes scabra]